MSEQTMRHSVTSGLKPLDAIAIENRVGSGTPDVNYIEGFIELKWLGRWPRSEERVVTIPHFTTQQRNWLRRRQRRGGDAWLLLQVHHEWLLFTGLVAAEHVGNTSVVELRELAHRRWDKGMKYKELIECLNLGSQLVESDSS